MATPGPFSHPASKSLSTVGCVCIVAEQKFTTKPDLPERICRPGHTAEEHQHLLQQRPVRSCACSSGGKPAASPSATPSRGSGCSPPHLHLPETMVSETLQRCRWK